MGSNRFNKSVDSKSVPDYTPRKKKEVDEISIALKPCCVCKKNISDGYYAHWGDAGVCSRACDMVRNHEERIPNEITHVSTFNGRIFSKG